ncbi:MAG: hypothetical protein KKD86_17940 [Bacteroidetes bacterium]|nr:hypothetical protein [Bacteroidota bacterium]
MKSLDSLFKILTKDEKIFFNFMKGKYPVIQNSNIFARDIQYAIQTFFDRKDITVNYSDSETLMKMFTDYLEKENKLTKLDKKAWKVNFSLESNVESVGSNNDLKAKEF